MDGTRLRLTSDSRVRIEIANWRTREVRFRYLNDDEMKGKPMSIRARVLSSVARIVPLAVIAVIGEIFRRAVEVVCQLFSSGS